MSDKRKKRIRALQAELGCSYRTACNEYEKRKRSNDESRKLGATFADASKGREPAITLRGARDSSHGSAIGARVRSRGGRRGRLAHSP